MPIEKFSAKELDHAINRLRLMKFFPPDAAAHAALAELLAKICPHREALEWLVSTLQNHIAEWPGAHEVRGLLCTRYDAADGVDAWCSLPGFTAGDAEERYYDRHTQLTGKAVGYDEPFQGATCLLHPQQFLQQTSAARGTAGGFIADEANATGIRRLAAEAGITGPVFKPVDPTPPASRPPVQERKPTPVSDFERNLLRAEAEDESLGVEARERAKRILARLDSAEATG